MTLDTNVGLAVLSEPLHNPEVLATMRLANRMVGNSRPVSAPVIQ